MKNTPLRTSGIIIIGNEILSGRTQELNAKYLAQKLLKVGVTVNEVRIIPDVKEKIIECVNEIRKKYTFVFTSGGIGPTHDDITSECIAIAFGVLHLFLYCTYCVLQLCLHCNYFWIAIVLCY